MTSLDIKKAPRLNWCFDAFRCFDVLTGFLPWGGLRVDWGWMGVAVGGLRILGGFFGRWEVVVTSWMVSSFLFHCWLIAGRRQVLFRFFIKWTLWSCSETAPKLLWYWPAPLVSALMCATDPKVLRIGTKTASVVAPLLPNDCAIGKQMTHGVRWMTSGAHKMAADLTPLNDTINTIPLLKSRLKAGQLPHQNLTTFKSKLPLRNGNSTFDQPAPQLIIPVK